MLIVFRPWRLFQNKSTSIEQTRNIPATWKSGAAHMWPWLVRVSARAEKHEATTFRYPLGSLNLYRMSMKFRNVRSDDFQQPNRKVNQLTNHIPALISLTNLVDIQAETGLNSWHKRVILHVPTSKSRVQ